MKHHRPRYCHLCGERLRGRSWVYAPPGGSDAADSGSPQALVVCRGCHENAPRCATCGLPIGENHVRLPDDRQICRSCSRTAILDGGRARALFDRVASVIATELGLGLDVGTDFALVDPCHLRRLVQEVRPELSDDPENVVGLFVREGRKRVMYILSGLPESTMIQTIAHEWAHAWQGENCPLLKDPVVREGFAEWTAYKALRTMGAPGKAALSEARGGLYGEGLEAMLRLERESGVAGVLALCRRSA